MKDVGACLLALAVELVLRPRMAGLIPLLYTIRHEEI